MKDRAPHADTDPRRKPDPNRKDIPERLRRKPADPYSPTRGRSTEKAAPDQGRHARRRHVAKNEED